MEPMKEGMSLLDYWAENEDKFCIWDIGTMRKTMRLYKTSDNTFRTIEQGAWAPVLSTHVCTIVREDLLTFLQPYIVEQIDFHPVTIYDRPSESHVSGYYLVSSKESYNYEYIKNADHAGKRAWVAVGSVAVTRDLKKVLEQSDIPDLDFSPFHMVGC